MEFFSKKIWQQLSNTLRLAQKQLLLIGLCALFFAIGSLFTDVATGGHLLQKATSPFDTLLVDSKKELEIAPDPPEKNTLIQSRPSVNQTTRVDGILLETIANPRTYSGLPVESSTLYNTTSSRGVAILIPQSHRYPGSEVEDSINDTAMVVQNNIYKLLSFLTHTFSITTIMAEGDPYGPVDPAKLSRIAEQNQSDVILGSSVQALQSEVAKDERLMRFSKDLVNQSTAVHNSTSRALILEGAPYKLKAEGANITLYGSENMETVEEGKLVVRDYIYLQDRLAALSQETEAEQLAPQNDLASIQALMNILSPAQPTDRLLKTLNSLERVLTTNPKDTVQSLISSTRQSLERMTEALKAPNNQQEEIAPSRSNNPYANETNRTALEEKRQVLEAKITDVVVNKRNEETAEHFSQMLEAERTQIAILQYGAGHEAGLVEELQERAISVVVIRPKGLKQE